MRTIEILGSPGVGKSTVSKCLSELWTPDEGWIPESQLLARPDPPPGPNLRTAYRTLRRLLGSRDRQPLAMWPMLSQRFIEQHQAFADLLIRTLATSVMNSEKDASKAFNRTIHLARTFAKLHCLTERCTAQLVVLDEGILKHASHLFLDEGFAPTRNRLLDDEVMPTSYVLLDAPGATIAERSVSRSKRTSHHEGMDWSALEDYCSRSAAMWRRIATGLLEAGKQVLILDAVRPPQENARKLRLFAQRLAKGTPP